MLASWGCRARRPKKAHTVEPTLPATLAAGASRRLQEFLLVLLGVLGLGGAALMVAVLPPLTLLWTAAALTALGSVLGVPGGIFYHWRLYRELRRLGPVPKGWLWHPTRHHDALDEHALTRMRPWFLLGALGFLVMMLGAGLATLTLVTHFT